MDLRIFRRGFGFSGSFSYLNGYGNTEGHEISFRYVDGILRTVWYNDAIFIFREYIPDSLHDYCDSVL